MLVGAVSEKRVWMTTNGVDGESSKTRLRRRGLKMPISFQVWCEVLNNKTRKIRGEFKRKISDCLT